MKNKLLSLTALLVMSTLVLQVPVTAQPADPTIKSEKKDNPSGQSGILEERNKSNSDQDSQDPKFDRRTFHRGGKQNFQSREFYGGRSGHPGFRHFQYRHRAYGPDFYGQGFRSRQFRNYGFKSEGFRSRGFNDRGYRAYGRPEFRRNDFRPRGFNGQQGRPGQFNLKQDPAMKSLKDNIWKDGIMDLKERDMLRNKMKELRSQHHPGFNQKRSENIPNPRNDKK